MGTWPVILVGLVCGFGALLLLSLVADEIRRVEYALGALERQLERVQRKRREEEQYAERAPLPSPAEPPPDGR
jgi:hypothetical protein